jgi:hypothetical protein
MYVCLLNAYVLHALRKLYVCHHSSFRKVDADKNKRGLSKNTHCEARLNCKIRLSTIDTRKRDPYIKVNFGTLFKEEY